MPETLYELPAGWAWSRLGDIAVMSSGGTPSRRKREYWKGNIPWVKISDIPTNGRVAKTEESITEAGLWKSSAKLFPKGTILFTIFATIGKVGILEIDATTNQAICGIQPFAGIIREFLFHYLRYAGRNLAERTHGITQANINMSIAKELSVPVPPSTEQHRIIVSLKKLLERVQAAHDSLGRARSSMKRFRQSVLAKAFRGELTERDPNDEPAEHLLERIKQERRKKWEEDLKARGKDPRKHSYKEPQQLESEILPNTWVMVRVEHFCDLQVGVAFKSRDFKTSGVKLLRGANIAPGKIHWTDTKYLSCRDAESYKSFELDAGDIVIGMDRPIISSGVKIAKLGKSDAPSLLVQRVGRFIPQVVSSEYLYYLLSQDSFAKHLYSLQTGTDLPHVSATDILSFSVPLAPLEEQERIITKIEELFAYTHEAEKAVQAAGYSATSLEQSVLSRAFRGSLVPQDPNDEPASLLLERIRAQRSTTSKKRRSRPISEYASPAGVSAKP